MQKNHIQKLDDTIALTMKQIQCGQKIAGDESYKKMKAKIKKMTRDK